MNNSTGNTDASRSRRRSTWTESDLDSASRALDHTCWFLSRQLTGNRNVRKFSWRISDRECFIVDQHGNEVERSRKPIRLWVEIGKQFRLALAVIWLKVRQYPKPSQEPDPSKKVTFWWSFDGIRRVFVFEATRVDGRKLTDKEIDKRYNLHRRLWVLASQGAAVEQLLLDVEKKFERRDKKVLGTLSQVGEQLGLLKPSSGEFSGASRPQLSPKRKIAYPN